MDDLTSEDANIQSAMLDVVAESVSGAFLVYDRNDLILFASPQLRNFFPKIMPAAGGRMRDFFGSIYDTGKLSGRDALSRPHRSHLPREDWVAEQIASLWKERSETLERCGPERWISYTKRRLPSGYGVCLVRDVSETKKREDQWRADLERVQVTEDILDNLPVPILVKDRNFQFVAVNKAACALYGLPATAILGRRLSDLHKNDFVERLDDPARQVMESGNSLVTPEQMIRADGREASIVTSRYRIGKPGRYFVVSVINDISALAEADFAAPSSDPVPSLDFSASGMSDEAAAAALRPAPPMPEGRRVLLVTADEALASDTLAILLEAGIDCSQVDDAAELEVFLDIAAEADVSVDLVLCEPAMQATLCKATEEYGIDLLALAPSTLRGDLMAALARNFAERSGRSQAAAADDDWQIEGSSQIDVLVAEDNAVNQIVFSQILEGLGYRYIVAADGAEAVRIWQEQRPRAVLMDITLPSLNGFEATRRIRELEGGSGATVVIGVLQPAFENDREQCQQAGMDAVLIKPVSSDAVEAVFNALGLGGNDSAEDADILAV
ncbi:response regulator [Rhizobiales bacterium RZME27]|uniref:Response regulator n=1 Tax=Endobacterium cereale TaxID=2663029 RepID=A0A6A8A8W2_9HYPH|nr:response regulator [Endobacterium cereale]MEB2846889.1 response regulator [Endobacterium cereale]MQY47692.1 response regulator [Endobacterium cereale]